MKRKQPKSRTAILEILRVTGKTQKQFAEDIGAEAGEVRQWTTVRTVPAEYRRRIMAATGAEWDESGKVWQAGGGKRRQFTLKSFVDWRERLISLHHKRLGFQQPFLKPNGERYDRYNIEVFLNGRVKSIIGRTMAAVEDRGGMNNYRRLFAVLESLIHWSQRIVKDFKLSDSKHIQDVHRISKSGILESTHQEKYIRLMQSIIDPAAVPNYPSNSIIEKGSPRHNAHLEHLKAMVKNGRKADANSKDKADAKAAAANLKLHGIEV